VFNRILIANRGEIACRIMRTAHQLGIETVAVYSDADASALHTQQATTAVHIGAAPALDSYLRVDKIIQAALDSHADAIHPGYGFLSENPEFVEAVEAAGLVFIGPSAAAIRAMGLKDAAKELMQAAGVPVVPGYHGSEQSPQLLQQHADAIGYPILIKARAGGGGKGMRLVESSDAFFDALASAQREAQSSFNDKHVLLEKFIASPRHIEVQIMADEHGNVVHLYERDCSVQRRHQKVIEEAPAPGMTEALRSAMTNAAITAAKTIKYANAGTIEFIVDGSGSLHSDKFWFMEMNTRLQVEHPVTEAITGLDLVELQLRVAAGETLPVQQSDVAINGHSFEARVYAENVRSGFLPVSGTVEHCAFDVSARIDSAVQAGDTITPFYDPMIAKITVQAADRNSALHRLQNALQRTHIAGTTTNLSFLQAIASNNAFRAGAMDTGLVEKHLSELTRQPEESSLQRLLGCLLLTQINEYSASQAGLFAWRLWGNCSQRIKLIIENELYTHRLGLDNNGIVSLHLDADDAAESAHIRILQLTESFVRYTHENQTSQANFVRWHAGGAHYVSLQDSGSVHVYSSPDALAAEANVEAKANAIVAPMTGVIQTLNTEVGAAVKAGDVLLVLEAMKMETSLAAPRDGVVEAVHVAAGESVNDGGVLISFEADADAAG